VHGPPFERVVEVFTVRGRSVDECGAKSIETAAAADHCAGASTINACDGGCDVIRIASRYAEPGDVKQEAPRGLARFSRQHGCIGRGKPGGELLSERRHVI
jgi:hypothetical protein